MSPKVSIIILNWNGWKDTIECLESLYQIDYPNYDVIVVDNDSNDDSIKKIKKYCKGEIKVKSKFVHHNTNNKPIKIFEFTKKESESNKKNYNSYKNLNSDEKLIIIKNNQNYGFAEGNNIGIRYAINSLDTNYILLLNNDTIVDKDFLKELVNVGERNEYIGFVGPKTYYYNKKNTIQAAGGGYVDFRHGVVHEMSYNEVDDGKYDQNVELDYVGGACLLCKTNVIKTIGILDPYYFMYWEDVNWCFTGKNHGYKSFFSYKSKIWHKYGASSESSFKIYYLNRNRIYFIKNHGNYKQKTSFLVYFFLYRFWIESFDYLIHRRDLKKYKSLVRGVVDGLMKH